MADSANISRSGRIRKRSTKLADFESPGGVGSTSSSSAPAAKKQRLSAGAILPQTSPQIAVDITGEAVDLEEVVDLDIQEDFLDGAPDPHDIDSDETDEFEEGALMIDDSRGRKTQKPAKKANRKKQSLLKQTPINSSTTYTPYLLWAKQAKVEIRSKQPDLPFEEVSKQLSQIWANLSQEDKLIWKQRSRKLALKEQQKKPETIKSETKSRKTSEGKVTFQQPKATLGSSPSAHTEQQKTSKSKLSSGDKNLKGITTQPIDSAAHLKLLGESLSVIGERLKEHEGQIAVSGSLSVLLDSLICALGPLLCLTQQVPELNVVPQETLGQILDNVAYIMPGL